MSDNIALSIFEVTHLIEFNITGEWEGAMLRNSRVSCNAILPLVSPKCTSEVPLLAVDSAVSDLVAVITGVLGARPKCMLWTTLHDARLLLLRIAYGEALNVDSGGGSLTSNSMLIFHLLHLSSMFKKSSKHDNTASFQHCSCLHLGYIAAWEILQADDFTGFGKNALQRGVADAAPMAALCCILHDGSENDGQLQVTSCEDVHMNQSSCALWPKKKIWEMYPVYFLKGLIRWAGKRTAGGIVDSGCTARRSSALTPPLKNSFVEWDGDATIMSDEFIEMSTHENKEKGLDEQLFVSRPGASLCEYLGSLRPMCALFAMFDCIFKHYRGDMTDQEVVMAADELVQVVESCQKATSLSSLLKASNIMLELDHILGELDKGRNTL